MTPAASHPGNHPYGFGKDAKGVRAGGDLLADSATTGRRSPARRPVVEGRDVTDWYGGFQGLHGVSVTVQEGEIVVIIGPSGSGKSTFLRGLNRLEVHSDAIIAVHGIVLSRDLRAVRSVRRRVGMVFQDFNLFPHLTVLGNVALAPVIVGKQRISAARKGPTIS